MPFPAAQPLYAEFWIDLSQKSAIQRHVIYSGSNPWTRTDIDWKQTEFGLWPDKWTLTWSMNGQVWRIQRLRIDSFEPNPAVTDADFTLEAKPGMRVKVADSPPPGPGLNPDLGPTRTYVISPSGSWQEVDAKGYTTLGGEVLPPEQTQSWIWWAVAAAGAGATALLFYAWRGRRKLTAA
jgi:hypothetical protein